MSKLSLSSLMAINRPKPFHFKPGIGNKVNRATYDNASQNEEIRVENEIRAGNEKLEETEREGDDIQISNDEFAPETNQFHEFYKTVSKGNNDEYNGRNVDNVTPLLDVVMTMVRMQALVDDEDVLLNSAFELRMQALVNNEDVLVNSALELSASANSKEDNVNSSKDGNIEHSRVNNRLINQ
ncbi:hypothetical protein Tco_0708350, partial [Tanacetum coccineum]